MLELPYGLHGAHLRVDLSLRLGRRRLRDAIVNGLLHPLWRGVLVESERLLDPRTRATAALLASGPDAVLTGPTASALHGCVAITAPTTHVVVPYSCRFRGRDGLVTHRGSYFADDVVLRDGLRMLSLERVTADILCDERPANALALADEVLRRAGDDHEPTRRRILEHIRRRHAIGDIRGTVRGSDLLDLASPRAESIAESWLRMILVEQGFPLAEVNWPLCDLDGREVYRLDLAWPSLRIAVEYDGYAAHVGRERADEARYEDLRRRGWLVVRATSVDLTDSRRLASELRSAFTRRGYAWMAA
ncbi:hypothetical protein [Pseudonocardia sp. TRM90224]|uniref:hypothetical protein n=1 Tax=Pseudonocardia sp. TRM90224 TaxID=2812678 RepID=UPI001E31C63A|nr:hypothetical protein [Pseudonocardia sp. TRM90224]